MPFVALITALFAGTAHAGTPTFSAVDPAHAELARNAWDAAIACTGWEAPAHAIVPIHTGFVPGGYSGGAQLDDAGLKAVVLGLDASERSLVHEVAHAWARFGPAALTEGRTDLLADCIVARSPSLAPLDPDTGLDLDEMPDLRTWDKPHVGDYGVDDTDSRRGDAYLGASRFLRVVATVIEPKRLWPEGGRVDWTDIERLLERAGPEGSTVLAVLSGGVEKQRAALSDRDHDGVPWLAEVLAGTNPNRWDSDGDGWWDGAPPPPSVAAVPLPPDGTPVCSGFAAGPGGARVQVLSRGELRGEKAPGVRVQAGDTIILDDPADGVLVPDGLPVLLSLEGPMSRATGGTWAITGGTGLVFDWNCRSTPSYTVWVDDARAAPMLEEMAAALDEHVHRADSLLGSPSRRRLVVSLGTEASGIAGGAVHLSTGQVAWARHLGRPDLLAGLAVALHRVWHGETARRWDTAEALTRALVDDPPEDLFVAVDHDATAVWLAQADACHEGWGGVLDGRCEPEVAERPRAEPSAVRGPDRKRRKKRKDVP